MLWALVHLFCDWSSERGHTAWALRSALYRIGLWSWDGIRWSREASLTVASLTVFGWKWHFTLYLHKNCFHAQLVLGLQLETQIVDIVDDNWPHIPDLRKMFNVCSNISSDDWLPAQDLNLSSQRLHPSQVFSQRPWLHSLFPESSILLTWSHWVRIRTFSDQLHSR